MMANNSDLRVKQKNAITLACDREFSKAKKFKNISHPTSLRSTRFTRTKVALSAIFIHR